SGVAAASHESVVTCERVGGFLRTIPRLAGGYSGRAPRPGATFGPKLVGPAMTPHVARPGGSLVRPEPSVSRARVAASNPRSQHKWRVDDPGFSPVGDRPVRYCYGDRCRYPRAIWLRAAPGPERRHSGRGAAGPRTGPQRDGTRPRRTGK